MGTPFEVSKRPRGKGLAIALTILGLATLAVAGFLWIQSLPIEVRVELKKELWSEGETIEGRLVLRNRSFRVFPGAKLRFSCVTPLNGEGEEPPAARPGGAWERPIEFDLSRLERRGVLTEDFLIPVEPLGQHGGWCLRRGAYRLTVTAGPVKGDEPSIPIRIVPATLTICAGENASYGSRILHFAAGDHRVNLLRIDGTIESRDLETGSVRSTGRVAGNHLQFAGAHRFSADGSLLAVLLPPDRRDPEHQIDFYEFSDCLRLRSVNLGASAEHGSPTVLPFLMDQCRVAVKVGDSLLAVDSRTGHVSPVGPQEAEFPLVKQSLFIDQSFDGKWWAVFHPRPAFEGVELEIWDAISWKSQCRIALEKSGSVSFSHNPTLLVCGHSGVLPPGWYEDSFEVHDPSTGELLRTLDLAPVQKEER